ncbi:MAG: hypothetical protein QOJ23_2786, partial [Actinomycetota bacterium]|nr:hypothetical protein [Actinomycetota bacterium]
MVLDDDVVRGLGLAPDTVQQVAEQESRELLRREQEYREGRPMPDLAGKVVILVDDGLATGSSMRAAIQALRKLWPARVVVAVPAAPESTCAELAAEVDEVICATTPSPFLAVGRSYWDFTQTTDEEVRRLLRVASGTRTIAAGGGGDVSGIRSEAAPWSGGRADYDELTELVGDAHFVLIGEASHGTHEFYAERAHITQRLIEEKGFSAVAVEADWPDAYRVNRYVQGAGDDGTAEEALRGFERFPSWMWRNAAVLDFVGWLRQHNDWRVGEERKPAGVYGLDLYSLFRSIDEVIAYLETVDPSAAQRARERYSCFDHFGHDAQAYGYAAAFGAGESCELQAVDQLLDLQRRATETRAADDELFSAGQNARTVATAEAYYRSMFGGRVSTWNLRDRHMADTLDGLAAHLTRQQGEPARIVVWAHNSHLGDARATDLGGIGEVNLGQLVRERHADDCLLVGFTTYTGTVTAADDWGAPAERKQVRPALAGSCEELFHQVGEKAFWLPFAKAPQATEILRRAFLERAIGVIYRPATERHSHYFRARMADQFDVVIHLDETRAVEPLERTARWERGELAETYPFAV